MNMKIDKYLKKRGGTAHMIYVVCAKCNQKVLYYQKDGPGWLKRCYLNRIFAPSDLELLQYDKKIKKPQNLPDLICSCGTIIGKPIIHKDGRLAYKLERKSFLRKNYKKNYL